MALRFVLLWARGATTSRRSSTTSSSAAACHARSERPRANHDIPRLNALDKGIPKKIIDAYPEYPVSDLHCTTNTFSNKLTAVVDNFGPQPPILDDNLDNLMFSVFLHEYGTRMSTTYEYPPENDLLTDLTKSTPKRGTGTVRVVTRSTS